MKEKIVHVVPPIGFPSVFGAIVGTLVPIKGALVDEHVSLKRLQGVLRIE